MEKLNRDELFKIAILLDLPELLAFCRSSNKIDKLICQKNDIWIYKLKTEFPNYQIPPNGNYYNIYTDILNNSLPTKHDKNKQYNILELYKSVEKEYNTREEFEKFVRKITDIENLIVDEEGNSLYDFVFITEDELGSYEPLNNGSIVIYFSYPKKRVKWGPAREYYNKVENFGLWSK